MDTVKYKNNKYTKYNNEWYIIGEDHRPPQPVTIGSLVKLQHPEIITKLEEIDKSE